MEFSGLKLKMEEDGQREKSRCVHHWIIEETSDAINLGKCKFCGEERMFTNEFKS